MGNLASVNPDRRLLAPWEELVGRLVEVEETQGRFVIRLTSGTLSFDTRSKEAAILRDALSGMEGRQAAVLRIDLPDRPIVASVREDG